MEAPALDGGVGAVATDTFRDAAPARRAEAGFPTPSRTTRAAAAAFRARTPAFAGRTRAVARKVHRKPATDRAAKAGALGGSAKRGKARLGAREAAGRAARNR